MSAVKTVRPRNLGKTRGNKPCASARPALMVLQSRFFLRLDEARRGVCQLAVPHHPRNGSSWTDPFGGSSSVAGTVCCVPRRAVLAEGRGRGREGQRGQAGLRCLPACQGWEAVARCSKHGGARFSSGLGRAKGAACQPALVRGFSDGLPQAAAGRTKVQQDHTGRRRRGRRCAQGRQRQAQGRRATKSPGFLDWRPRVVQNCAADHQLPTVSVPCGSR